MKKQTKSPRLIVHGGAWDIPDELVEEHITGVYQAITDIAPQMQQGMSALEAVEAAVNILEELPVFDAGRGSFLNAAGEIELDAMIMDGSNLEFGAVAALQNILHPVSVAKSIYHHPDHCFFVGAGAQQFARENGFEEVQPESLLTDKELALFQKLKKQDDFRPHHPFGETPKGTVGAVALDSSGNIAAATSTGGTPRKLSGRVGDTPIIGAGTYADNSSGGVSATGWGESIMKVLLAKTICDGMIHSDAQSATGKALSILQQRVGGLAGAVTIDKNGRYGMAHNTPRMAFAFLEANGTVTAGIDLN